MSEITLREQLQAHASLHRQLQGCLSDALEEFMPSALQSGEFASDSYELGMSVGATEVLRFTIPLLAECVDGNPLSDERLRHLLGQLRACREELVGDDSLEFG